MGGDLCHTYLTDTVGQDPCQDWTLLERAVRKCIPENALACLFILTTQVFSASTDEKMHLITWVAIWDPFVLSSQLALHHTRQESREESLLVSPALPKAPLQPWNTLFPSTLPSFPTVSPCPCHTEEAEACQALPTPPKVRVLSRFHLRKGEHLFEVICFDCEQESHLAAIPASNPWACWVNLALFSGWASVSSLVPSTSPEWERAELHNRGLDDATRSFTSHLVLHRCQVLRQRARPHQPASLCTLLLGRECDYKSLCKTRAILGKRLSRKPWTTNVRCFRPAGVSGSSHCISVPANVHLNL